MECSYSLSFFATVKPPLKGTDIIRIHNNSSSSRRNMRSVMEISTFSYQKFIHFALEETKRHTQLVPSPLQENFGTLTPMDEKTKLQLLSYKTPKIRLLRSLHIEGNEGMQVFDFAVFPEPEFDLPIFCANFFTTASTNIVILDFNPLHDVIGQRNYKEKYFKNLMHLGLHYAELLPWGGKLTSESLRFFSPIVIWTKFPSSQHKHAVLYSAFKDYYKAWLDLMDRAAEESDASRIVLNSEAQHRYLTWRAEKDPGHRVLRRLIGKTLAQEVMRNFLFHGIGELGSRTFLDYFPEYKCEDGSMNEKRSMIGKSFENRPWDTKGEFIGTTV